MRLSHTPYAKRRLAGIAVAVVATALMAPTAFAADSYPPTDDSAVASAQPVVSGYRVQDIRDWTPESDPYAEHLRATVPLQPRISSNPDTQVKPELDGKAEIMLMQGDYGNSFFGSTTHNNTFGDLAFNFWQYADYFSPWHGGASIGVPQAIYDPTNSDWRNRGFEFGIMTLPTPEYTNAAHRNGVKSVAILYFDPYFRPGLTFKELFEKDPESDGYLIANKLIEMANYYGFDGYFLNEEEGGPAKEKFKPFMAYLTSQGLYTQWYDTNSSFNEHKAQWLRDSKHGQIHNSVFVNYGNSGRDMRAYADAYGYDPYAEVFAGIEANQTGFASDGGVSRGFSSDDNHSPLTSLALFTPSDMYQRGLDDDIRDQTGRQSPEFPFMQQQPYQWMIADRERMYFSGPQSDVTRTGAGNVQTRPDVGVSKEGWIGVADFAPARSVISGSTFATTFSTGKGMRSYTNGVVSSTNQWTDIGAQAILPSWQWWFETNDAEVTLNADFDYGEEPRRDLKGNDIATPFQPVGAYNGGNSLVVYGDTAGTQTLRLFKTDLAVQADSQATVTWRATNTGETTVALGLIFADAPDEVTTIDLGDVPHEWESTQIDLSSFAGRSIATIGLVFEGDATGAQFNIGELTVGPSTGAVPATPSGLKIDELLSDGQMNVRWDRADFTAVDYYVLEAIEADGQVKHLARTYGDVRYIKHVPTEGDFTLRLRAIGKDGSSSAPADIVVTRSQLPVEVSICEAEDANGYFVQAADENEVTVRWDPPASGAPQSYQVRIDTLFADAKNPYRGYAHTTVGGEETSVTLPAPPEGLQFRATVTPSDMSAEAVGMSARSRYFDAYARPLEARDIVVGDGTNYHLNNPTATDWQQVVSQGDDDWIATRGKNANAAWGNNDPNAELTVNRELNDSVTYTLVDYAGNESDPVTLTVDDGSVEIVDGAAPRVWASPWNNQDVPQGNEMEAITVAAVDNVSKVVTTVGFVDSSEDGNEIADLAEGIAFDPQTGIISGTPTWEGERTLRITGVDESGNEAIMDIVVTAHGVLEAEPTEEPSVTPTDDPSGDTTDQPSAETSADPTSVPTESTSDPSAPAQGLPVTGVAQIGILVAIALALGTAGAVLVWVRRSRTE